jgi:hypothetical protein
MNTKYEYCEFTFYKGVFKNTIIMNYDNSSLVLARNKAAIDTAFSGMRVPIDALNYMDQLGWELVSSHADHLWVCYILRKSV